MLVPSSQLFPCFQYTSQLCTTFMVLTMAGDKLMSKRLWSSSCLNFAPCLSTLSFSCILILMLLMPWHISWAKGQSVH